MFASTASESSVKTKFESQLHLSLWTEYLRTGKRHQSNLANEEQMKDQRSRKNYGEIRPPIESTKNSMFFF